MDELRWSAADTPYCADYPEIFSAVNERLQGMILFVDFGDMSDEERLSRAYITFKVFKLRSLQPETVPPQDRTCCRKAIALRSINSPGNNTGIPGG
jgi:hypothetical protein